MTGTLDIRIGDVRTKLRELPEKSVQCVVTSPPYWGLRNYGVDGQIGLEPTVKQFVAVMVEVFQEVRRVLRDDGTIWVNMGDCYANGTNNLNSFRRDKAQVNVPQRRPSGGLKPKDLVGQPWRLAFALQDDGWILRQDIIWHKPNPMPESVTDRCTKAHEYIFLLSKSERYYYDAEAISEPVTGNSHKRGKGMNPKAVSGWDTGPGSHDTKAHNAPKDQGRVDQDLRDSTKFGRGAGWRNKQNESFSAAVTDLVDNRNKRSVWTIPTEAYSEAHFATFPTALVRPCIMAGSRIGDTILDPFGGSGTTAAVALEYGRNAVLIDLNPKNELLMRDRCAPHLGQAVLL